MSEQEYTPTPLSLHRRRFIRAVSGVLLTCSSLTACSQYSYSECGQTVELDLNRTPNAFMTINEEDYALYVDDFGDVRRVGLSTKGNTMQDQVSNKIQDVDLEGKGKTLSGSLEIDGIQVSFISAKGSDMVQTNCSEPISTLH
ncbi:MAG: hypothetical protein ABIQ64_01435 [Candidatus Saccharimonadales bacterium]